MKNHPSRNTGDHEKQEVRIERQPEGCLGERIQLYLAEQGVQELMEQGRRKLDEFCRRFCRHPDAEVLMLQMEGGPHLAFLAPHRFIEEYATSLPVGKKKRREDGRIVPEDEAIQGELRRMAESRIQTLCSIEDAPYAYEFTCGRDGCWCIDIIVPGALDNGEGGAWGPIPVAAPVETSAEAASAAEEEPELCGAGA